MAEGLRGGVWIDDTPVEKKIAGLGQKGLSVGPVNTTSGIDLIPQIKEQLIKNGEKNPDAIVSGLKIQRQSVTTDHTS